MTTRLSVNVNDETNAALRELAEKHGVTITEVIRRSVAVHKFFEDAQNRGDVIQLKHPRTGMIETVHLI